MRDLLNFFLACLLAFFSQCTASAQTTYMDAMLLFDAIEQLPKNDTGGISTFTANDPALYNAMANGYLSLHKNEAGDDPSVEGEKAPVDTAPLKGHGATGKDRKGNVPSPDPYEALVEADIDANSVSRYQLDRIATRMLADLKWAVELNALNATTTAAEFPKLIVSKPDGFPYANEIRAGLGILGASGPSTGVAFGDLLGINQTEIINGIVDWAVERAQEELLQAFLRRWLNDLKASAYLQLLVPSTLNMINTSDLTGMLAESDAWKSSFQDDLDHIPDRSDSLVILVLKRLKAKGDVAMSDPLMNELGGAAQVFASVYRELRNEKDLQTVLAVLAYRAASEAGVLPVTMSPGRTIAQRALIGTGALTDALRTEDDGKRGYVDPLKLVTMPDKRFGFLWKFMVATYPKQLKAALDVDDAKLAKLAVLLDPTDPAGIKIYEARAHLLNMLNQLHAIKKLTASTTDDIKNGGKSIDVQTATQYLDVVLQLLDNGMDFASSLNPNAEFNNHYRTNIKPLLQQVKQINTGVITHEYGQVVSGTLNLIEHLYSHSKMLDDSLALASKGVNTYLGFMVEMVTADSAAQVKAALKKVTMGTGSFRVKQTSQFSASLTLLPGGFYGRETAYLRGGGTVPDSLRNNTGDAAAFYLPIGININWGTGCSWFPSVGVFLQAIDLGSVMSYRLNPPDSVASAPNYSFGQLLSPGIGFTAHIGRSPVTVGYQWSWTPQLREVNSNGNVFNANTYRHGFTLGVDITAFQLFASKRKTNLAGIDGRVIP